MVTTKTQLKPIDEEQIKYRIRKPKVFRNGQGYKTFPEFTDTIGTHTKVWIGLNRGKDQFCMEAYTGRWGSRGLEIYLSESHPVNDPAAAYACFASLLETYSGETYQTNN